MRIAAALFIVALTPWSLAHAGRPIEERRSVDPKGQIEIVDVAGSVDVVAWDRPEVEVTGSVDDNVERVEVSSAGDRTSINVVMRPGVSRHGGEAALVVHMPAASGLSASLISADLKVAGIRGDVKLQTVSGDVYGDVRGDLRAGTVSGSLHMTASEAKRVELKTISGDVQFTGGGGEVEITTVSGSAKTQLGAVTRGRFKTVSGTVVADLALSPGAQVDGESVSGDVTFHFAGSPDADFDVQSFSGAINNCFGPAPVKAQYGPGSRLSFTSGTGHGRVRVDTKSGDVHLCTQGAG